MSKKLATLALVLAAAAAPALADDHEPTLEQILAAHFETIGGEDAWRALESVHMKGTMRMGPSMEAPIQMWFKSPNRTRMEFTVQGMTGIQAYDGETAWFVMPFMGKNEPEPMPADMAEQAAEQADVNPFLDWADKGHDLKLLGTEDVEGTAAYKIQLTRKSGNVSTYYFDTDHHLPFRVEGKANIQGQEVDTATTYGDYKQVDDLVFAHSIEIQPGGGAAPPQTLTIDSIATNVEVPESAFDMNAAKPEPAAAESGG